jgi:hypothetical protein
MVVFMVLLLPGDRCVDNDDDESCVGDDVVDAIERAADVGAIKPSTYKHFRWLAYKAVARKLGNGWWLKKKRKPLPACCELAIKAAFPELSFIFTHYNCNGGACALAGGLWMVDVATPPPTLTPMLCGDGGLPQRYSWRPCTSLTSGLTLRRSSRGFSSLPGLAMRAWRETLTTTRGLALVVVVVSW